MSSLTGRVIAATLLLTVLGTLCESFASDKSATYDSLSDVALKPAIHPTRLDYSAFDLPEAVTVITQEDIREAGYLKISEIFRGVPGFRIVNIGDEARVSYHGTAARQVRRMLVSINGRSVLVGDSEYVEFEHLPIALEDIERITVVRGPNGAAYGDNAFLVSIDFRTVGRDDPQGITLRGGYGHNGRERFGIAANEQLGAYQLAFSANRELDGGYDYFDRSRTPRDDGLQINRALFSLERELARSRWRLEANFYDSENRTGTRAVSFTGTQQNEAQFVALSNKREIGESSRLDWYMSYNRQREKIHQTGCYTPDAIARTTALPLDTRQLEELLAPSLFVPALLGTSLADTCFFTDVEIDSARKELGMEYESQFKRWRYLFGASANRTDAESGEYFAGHGETQTSYRAFGESDLTAGPLHASVGFMAQYSSNVQRTEPAWRGALTWQFLRNQALRYSYARSFRIPSLRESEVFWTGAFEFGRRGQPETAYPVSVPVPLIVGPGTLEPETIDSHSIGYFGTFLRSSASVDIKLFSETLHNPIESSLFYFSPPPFNSRSFTIKGAELEAKYVVTDHWKISGQYSYLDNTTRDPVELGLQGRNAGSLQITYQPVTNHSFTVAYYGNSNISGHSYTRYDFVYNYGRTWSSHLFRSKLLWQHHATPGEGLHDANPLLSNEGYFARVDQLFLSLELTL